MSRNLDRCPTHPGELLREDVIPATGESKAEVARMLGICPIPDDHIAPRRSALFMARSLLREVREGVRAC